MAAAAGDGDTEATECESKHAVVAEETGFEGMRFPLLSREIVAPFKIPLDAQLRSAIAASLLSHILYARNQTPMLLRQTKLEDVEQTRKTPQYRKKVQMVRNYCRFSETLPLLFQNDVSHVVLLLGPNPMNPREVYDLCFHSQCLNNESETSSRTQRAVEKKLSRILLQPNEDHDWFSNPPRPTKCWILVLSDTAPDGFVWKRSFRVRKPVGRKSESCKMSIRVTDQYNDEDTPTHIPNFYWWQWKDPLVGFS